MQLKTVVAGAAMCGIFGVLSYRALGSEEVAGPFLFAAVRPTATSGNTNLLALGTVPGWSKVPLLPRVNYVLTNPPLAVSLSVSNYNVLAPGVYRNGSVFAVGDESEGTRGF